MASAPKPKALSMSSRRRLKVGTADGRWERKSGDMGELLGHEQGVANFGPEANLPIWLCGR